MVGGGASPTIAERPGETVTELAASLTTSVPGHGSDPLIAALARYVEALHARYPDGPDQMRRESLDARGNMPRMCKNGRGQAA
jgi:hypothetical protein